MLVELLLSLIPPSLLKSMKAIFFCPIIVLFLKITFEGGKVLSTSLPEPKRIFSQFKKRLLLIVTSFTCRYLLGNEFGTAFITVNALLKRLPDKPTKTLFFITCPESIALTPPV